MKVYDLAALLGLSVLGGTNGLEKQITGGYSSDLLSDVMGNIEEGMLWITMQTHRNVIAVASLKEVAAVIIVNGAVPDEETLLEAESENIALLGTTMSAFELSGKLYCLFQCIKK